jgi:hypothetical protein
VPKKKKCSLDQPGVPEAERVPDRQKATWCDFGFHLVPWQEFLKKKVGGKNKRKEKKKREKGKEGREKEKKGRKRGKEGGEKGREKGGEIKKIKGRRERVRK